MHKLHSYMGAPKWDQFLALWVEGVEEHPTLTLPRDEITLMIHALQSMRDTTVLQHPRVAVAPSRSPPKLYVPARKRHMKFENAEELDEKYGGCGATQVTPPVWAHINPPPLPPQRNRSCLCKTKNRYGGGRKRN